MTAPEMTAPHRIWAQPEWVMPSGNWSTDGRWFTIESGVRKRLPYILATPEALAASPEVQALINAAVKVERERACGALLAASVELRLATAVPGAPPGGKEIADGFAEMLDCIAAAIRKGYTK